VRKAELTPEGFDRLLAWLSPQPEDAGKIYEDIRKRLIRFFTYRRSTFPEELADETITRVARKIVDIADDYDGDPLRYCYGVARNVQREHLREPPSISIDDRRAAAKSVSYPIEASFSDSDRQIECLERCMEQLVSSERILIFSYFEYEKKAKIDHRKELARRLGIALNALRIRVFRIRERLRKCVEDCLKQRTLN